ncbi:helix-turn-helix domain-containing protein [Agrococcus sp. Marseille-Q4369]|uniref:helix-turn-helix transcriptional regulator n=1 Tax=Agrococcus sp. Marseille-Q4369 TaxID=2810513 RepID=UPI0032D5AD96
MTSAPSAPTGVHLVPIDLLQLSPGVLLRERDVAAALHISVKTLQHHRQRGTGPRFVRLGRHVRYYAGDVVAWIEANRA